MLRTIHSTEYALKPTSLSSHIKNIGLLQRRTAPLSNHNRIRFRIPFIRLLGFFQYSGLHSYIV